MRNRLPGKSWRIWNTGIFLCDPSCGSVSFFVMVGHLFGMTASVMFYCRRSYALNQFLIRCLRMASMSVFDDKFAFCQAEVAQRQKDLVLSIGKWLGIRMSDKTEWGKHVTDSTGGPEARDHPSFAGRLVSSRCRGQDAREALVHLQPPLWQEWKNIPHDECRSPVECCRRIHAGRCIASIVAYLVTYFRIKLWCEVTLWRIADTVVSDHRDVQSCQDLLRAGWVACIGEGVRLKTKCFSALGSSSLSMVARRSERENQIVMVDMIGCLLAIDYQGPRSLGLFYTFLIDSEPVEGALVEGSSGHSDITTGASIFWNLCVTISRPIFPTSAVSPNVLQTPRSCRKLKQSGSM